MPIAVKNEYRVNITTLLEVREAANAVVRVRDPEFGITVSQVLNYFMLHGLKDTFMKVHECGEDIQKEIIHFNYLRMVLLRDPSKKTVSIGDVPVGSSTYVWWTSLFEITEVFSRSEILEPTGWANREYVLHKKACDSLVRAMAALDERKFHCENPGAMKETSRVLRGLIPDRLDVRPTLAVVK